MMPHLCQVVQVKSYDRHRKRYVVRLADGTLRRVQAKRLRATEATARPRLSLCSAWKKTLKVVLTDDTSSKALGSLDFQACEDIEAGKVESNSLFEAVKGHEAPCSISVLSSFIIFPSYVIIF